MTYNVGAGPADPRRLVEGLRQSGADIIGVQESASDQGAAIAALLRDDYPYQVLHPTGIPGKGLISRFPVHETELLELHPGRPDLQAIVVAPGGDLSVIVAHPPPPRLGRHRIRQAALADQQISGIAAVATRGNPAVLLTDFNRVGWQAAYRQLRRSGLIDAFGTAGRGAGFTLPPGSPISRIVATGLAISLCHLCSRSIMSVIPRTSAPLIPGSAITRVPTICPSCPG